MAFEYQNFASLSVNLNRQKYGPLDISNVFTSQADLNYYLSKGANKEGVSQYWLDVVPYPYAGQIVSLVTEGVESVYVLHELENGNFETMEVGKSPVGDNVSIEVNEDVISLKDFGKRFYKYVAAVGEEGQEGYKPAEYVLTEVSETNPWSAGLEPKTILQDGKYVIGWYEPNPTTVEGVQDQVSAVQGTVSDLDKTIEEEVKPAVDQLNEDVDAVEKAIAETITPAINELEEKVGTAGTVEEAATGLYLEVDNLKAADEAIEGRLDTLEAFDGASKDNVSTAKQEAIDAAAEDATEKADKALEDAQSYANTKKQEAIDAAAEDATEKANQALTDAKAYTLEQIAAVDHLKRSIVTELPAAEAADSNTIYMVKDSSVLGADKYNEWMLIEGELVQIGDTTVDLSGYDTSSAVDAKVKVVSDLLSEEIQSRIDNDSTHDTGIREAKEAAAEAQADVDALSGEIAGLAEFVGELPEGSAAISLVDYVNKKTEGIATDSALAELQAQVNTNTTKVNAAEKSLADLVAITPEKNKIESILVDGVALAIAEDRSVSLPGATLQALGLVKGSEVENGIYINDDFTMTINNVNVNKLVQTEGEELVLNCGGAAR